MTVRKFMMSTQLDNALASANSKAPDQAAPKRSEVSAKQETQSFSKEEKDPLAAHKNPESKPGITFAAQEKLPKLPIPDLESSLKKYVAALDPLQTAREHRDTQAAVHDFLREQGPELQERLKKYAVGQTSYIEQFCMLSCRHMTRSC